MPNDEMDKLLWDVLDAGRAAARYVEDCDIARFEADRQLRASVEWELAVLGEALNRLRKRFPQSAARINEIDRIIAFRNVLVHGYDIIDIKRLWQSVKRDLPVLLKDVETLTGHHE
ncbi:MAG: HepT-like ribonuclease domain-containing protein [Phycisphaerales bacterium]